MHGLDPTEEEEALEWRQSSALSILQEGHAMSELRIPHANKASRAVGVTAEELRG
jgi:hypothetical protein